MSNELIFLLCFITWLVVVLLIARAMRINGSDHDAQQAADSVRQSLDADSRFDELRTYTHPRIKAGTAYGKAIK